VIKTVTALPDKASEMTGTTVNMTMGRPVD
jgi:hypothetical protein